MKQWESSIKKLSDIIFDGNLDKLRMFLSKLKIRALIAGRTTIFNINGKSKFDDFGMITHNECIDNAKTYYILDASDNIMDS